MEYKAEHMVYKGKMEGHGDAVTSLATTHRAGNMANVASSERAGNMLVSSSRDNKVLVWDLNSDKIEQEDEDIKYGRAIKSLSGHGHYVQDVDLSLDGSFVLSGSWDNSVRLWDLSTGDCPPTYCKKRHFEGHTKDVLSVAFSADNRQIISGSRDHTIRLWNTRGQCKFVMGKTKGSDKDTEGHSDWVSCVRFSPNPDFPVFVSGGWDKMVKVWSLNNCKLMYNLIGHSGYVNTVTIAPDSSLCASGGRDGTAMLWDLKEGKHLYSLEAGEMINSMCFSPNRYWLCTATPDSIIIWDLVSKEIVEKLQVDWGNEYSGRRATKPQCTSLAWGEVDGETLFAGFTDGTIRVWRVQA